MFTPVAQGPFIRSNALNPGRWKIMQQTILIADDDPHIRDVIAFAMQQAGFQTRLARDGAECLSVYGQDPADLIILDIGMPELDGLEVCRALRKVSEVPILFLTARDEEIDRIVGFEIGGDDYVAKPFSPRELVGRVRAILKRANARPEPATEATSWGALALDRDTHEARFGATRLGLTAREFEIIATLISRPRHVHSRERIMRAAYGGNIHVSDRTIDSHVRNIRAKLAAAGAVEVIETVHGVGFRLRAVP